MPRSESHPYCRWAVLAEIGKRHIIMRCVNCPDTITLHYEGDIVVECDDPDCDHGIGEDLAGC